MVWDCPVGALELHGLSPIDDEADALEVDDEPEAIGDVEYDDESTSADPVTADAHTRFITEGDHDG